MEQLPPIPLDQEKKAGFRCRRCGDWKPVEEGYAFCGIGWCCASCSQIYDVPLIKEVVRY